MGIATTTTTATATAAITAAGGAARRVTVLVVDDSAAARNLLIREISRDARIEVVGVAADAYAARDQIVALRPDVVTLDIHMPRMDGITFLRRLMKYRPTPVVVVSALGTAGAPAAVEALAAGAVDVVCKVPPADGRGLSELLAEKILAASKARVCRPTPRDAAADGPPASATTAMPPSPRATSHAVLALGASTGGVQALTRVIGAFPADAPATLLTQHMPAGFTASFAERLNRTCAVRVKEAAHGDALAPGRVLVAPGGRHMRLAGSAARYHVEITDGPEVCHQRPSIDVLFDSVAGCAGADAVGALLTGMGADGAQGLLRMRRAGARTLAQDEQSSAVFGMPAEAIRCGAAERVVALDHVAATMLALAGGIR